jgi:chemotaxis protein methyltransferase CheR
MIERDIFATQFLLDVSTNNETSFYRDAKVFKYIKSHILKISTQGNMQRPIRIWSCASSTGQEAYSIAMICEEMLHILPLRSYEILGTDISQRVLEQAKSGTYRQIEVQRGLPAPQLIKYFEPASEDMDHNPKWQIKQSVRSKVEFKKLNLLDPVFPNLGPFDIILCRNVLIYQPVENRSKIIKKIAPNLDAEGIFLVGAAESLIGIENNFIQTNEDSVVVYKNKPK